MKNIVPLKPQALYRRCDPSALPFETTTELADTSTVVGQARAMQAIEFGIGIRPQGYNLFALGSPGSGRHTRLKQQLEKRALSTGSIALESLGQIYSLIGTVSLRRA
jgi:predicted ATPase with chaperone activity